MIESDKALGDKEIRLGVGMLRRSARTFLFETASRIRRRENPIVYDGKYFRVRSTKMGMRFTCTFTDEQIANMKAKILEEVKKDIEKSFQAFLIKDTMANGK